MKATTFIETLVLFAAVALAALSCTVPAEVTLADLDLAIDQKMDQYDVPALSLAIVRNEKLVYVKSYGYSDDDPLTPATNDDRNYSGV